MAGNDTTAEFSNNCRATNTPNAWVYTSDFSSDAPVTTMFSLGAAAEDGCGRVALTVNVDPARYEWPNIVLRRGTSTMVVECHATTDRGVYECPLRFGPGWIAASGADFYANRGSIQASVQLVDRVSCEHGPRHTQWSPNRTITTWYNASQCEPPEPEPEPEPEPDEGTWWNLVCACSTVYDTQNIPAEACLDTDVRQPAVGSQLICAAMERDIERQLNLDTRCAVTSYVNTHNGPCRPGVYDF